MRSFFGLDSDFERPLPAGHWKADVLVGSVLAMLASLNLLALISSGALDPDTDVGNLGAELGMLLLAGCLIAGRRRFPVWTLLLTTGAHFVIGGVFFDVVSYMAASQVLYFPGLYR